MRPSASTPVRSLVGVSRDRANRSPRGPGEVIEDELVRRESLRAEVAADHPVVDDDAILREPERRGHLIAQVERRLVRRDDAYPVVLEPHDRGARLERGLVNARRRELVLEDSRGAPERGVHFAMRLHDVSLVIRMRDGGPLAAAFEEPVRRRIGVKGRGVSAERHIHVEQGRQLLVLDRDETDRLFRDLARIGGDRRDAVPDEEDAVPAQHRPVLEPPPETLAANVRTGDDRAHSGESACAFRIHRHDARVRIRTPNEGRLERARHDEVRGVPRGTGRLVHAVDPALGPVEELGMDQRAATVARRHSANPASTLSAWRAMSA